MVEKKNKNKYTELNYDSLKAGIDDLHRWDISSKIFCDMIKNSTPASDEIKKIIEEYLKDKNFKNEREIKSLVEENIISILFAKFKKRKLFCIFVYSLIILILGKIISLNSLIDFLVVIIKKYLP